MEHLIKMLKYYGIHNFIIAIGYKSTEIMKYFGDGSRWGINITYSVEKEPLGTAGPIKLARKSFNSTFLVTNADELKDIDILEMYNFHVQNRAKISIALTTISDPTQYGVVKMNGNKIIDFVEKPSAELAPSNLINAGLYLMEPDVIDSIEEGYVMLEKDIFPLFANEDKVIGYPFGGQWFDTGTMERYENAITNWKGFKYEKQGE